MRNALYYVGDLWKNNEMTVADEHLATGTTDIILTRYLLEKKEMEPSKRVLFFCIEVEAHVLGLKMVSSFFKENGWDTQFLGANLPLKYAVYSEKKWKASVIGISVTMVHHIPLLPNYIMELEKARPHYYGWEPLEWTIWFKTSFLDLIDPGSKEKVIQLLENDNETSGEVNMETLEDKAV